MAPINSYVFYNTAFDGTLSILSICSIILMSITVLGIKFKWFRARLQFNNHEPTNRNAVVGVYKQNYDSEFSTYSETSTSTMYSSVDNRIKSVDQNDTSAIKTFKTKDERINNKYRNNNDTKLNFDDVLSELNSIEPKSSTINNSSDNESGYLNEINPSYFNTDNEYLTVIDDNNVPELPKSDPPTFDKVRFKNDIFTEELNIHTNEEFYNKVPMDKEHSRTPINLKKFIDDSNEASAINPKFNKTNDTHQNFVINRQESIEQYSSTAANIFLRKSDKNSVAARGLKQNEHSKKQRTPIPKTRPIQMKSNDDNLSISSGTSA